MPDVALASTTATVFGLKNAPPRLSDTERGLLFAWALRAERRDALEDGRALASLLPVDTSASTHPLSIPVPHVWTWEFDPFAIPAEVTGPLLLQTMQATGPVDFFWSAQNRTANGFPQGSVDVEEQQCSPQADSTGDPHPSAADCCDPCGSVAPLRLHGPTVLAFVEAIRRRYRRCHFHGFAHGLQVCQASLLLLAAMEGFGPYDPTECQCADPAAVALREGRPSKAVVAETDNRGSRTAVLTPVERLATLIAGLVHDVDHPAINNDFLVRKKAPVALQYDNVSVLENHHAATATLLLHDPRTAMLATLSRRQVEKARRTLVTSILSTDMASHFRMVEQLKAMPSPFAPIDSDSDAHLRFSEVVVHCADMSAQVLPWYLSKKWADRLASEFQEQAEREEQEGLAVTEFMRNTKTPHAQAGLQLNFCSKVLLSLWQAVATLYPTLQPRVEQLQDNMDQYRSILSQSESAARHGHPVDEESVE